MLKYGRSFLLVFRDSVLPTWSLLAGALFMPEMTRKAGMKRGLASAFRRGLAVIIEEFKTTK